MPKAKSTGKNIGRKNLKPWKPGQSGNPKGRPPKGETWKDLIRQIGAMTGNEVAEWFATFAPQFRKVGDVQLKTAVIARAYLASINEPNGSVLKMLASYDDGLPPQAVEVGGSDKPIRVRVEYVDDPPAEAAPSAEAGQG